MPETVIAWKVVALIASGRKSTERAIKDVVYKLRSLVPNVRIDTEIFSLIPIGSKSDAAFDKALMADIVIGVIDKVISSVVINPSDMSEDFMAAAGKLIRFMNDDQVVSKALFIRFRPEVRSEAFRSEIKMLLGSHINVSKNVESNKDLELSLYHFLLENFNPQEVSKLALPSQGAGPHFRLNTTGQISNAPATSIDQSGNDLHRIGQLLPLISIYPGTA